MTKRKLWMYSKGVSVDDGKLSFNVQGRENERIGTLTLTETSITWRASYQRKSRTKTIPWEKFSEIMLATERILSPALEHYPSFRA